MILKLGEFIELLEISKNSRNLPLEFSNLHFYMVSNICMYRIRRLTGDLKLSCNLAFNTFFSPESKILENIDIQLLQFMSIVLVFVQWYFITV